MGFLSLILSPLGRAAAALGAILIAVAAIYGKGRRDASAVLEIKQRKDAQRRVENALEADARARRDIADGRLHDDDGHKRPD
jgi:hypothetical protein